MSGNSGCLGLIIVGAVIYYSGAGGWMVRQMDAVGENCYPLLAQMSHEIANPVCGQVTAGIGATHRLIESANEELSNLKERILGGSSFETIDEFTAELTRNVSDMASSSADLSRMMSLGPNGMSGLTSPFQEAIDSFAIGQNFFKNPSTSTQGLPWLQRSAQQPMGYGVMSQLSLGNLFAKGGNGIPANPRAAEAYLRQASQSLSILSSSNTPQAQQMLGTLPASPQQMQRDIDRAIRDLAKSLPH